MTEKMVRTMAMGVVVSMTLHVLCTSLTFTWALRDVDVRHVRNAQVLRRWPITVRTSGHLRYLPVSKQKHDEVAKAPSKQLVLEQLQTLNGRVVSLRFCPRYSPCAMFPYFRYAIRRKPCYRHRG